MLYSRFLKGIYFVYTSVYVGFLRWRSNKESTCLPMQETQEMWVRSLSCEDPEGKHGNPLQYSCLESPMDRGVWWTAVHGVAKSQTQLSMHTAIIVYVCQSQFPNLSTHNPPPPDPGNVICNITRYLE